MRELQSTANTEPLRTCVSFARSPSLSHTYRVIAAASVLEHLPPIFFLSFPFLLFHSRRLLSRRSSSLSTSKSSTVISRDLFVYVVRSSPPRGRQVETKDPTSIVKRQPRFNHPRPFKFT